jgi:pimeloyl-ACP methyl ester carboxylesterase
MRHEKYFIETSPGTMICIRIYQPRLRSPEKPYPVILIHGLLNSSELFDVPESGNLSFTNALSDEGYIVCAYDQRGSGESSNPGWNFGLEENVFTDLPAVVRFCLSHCGYDKAILGGYSLGGLIIYCFYSFLSKFSAELAGLKKENIHKIFTISSPGAFHQRTGRWKHIFTRGMRMLRGAGPVINRSQFIRGQIYIRSPLMSKFVGLSTIELCLKLAQKSPRSASFIKALPVPSFLYTRSDFDPATFMRVVRSRALDRTSRQIFQVLLHFAEQDGRIELDLNERTVSLPSDFQYWDEIPLLLISSQKDKLVCTSEVEEVRRRVNSAVLFNLDQETGQGCGHAGYLFKKGLTEIVRKNIIQFMRGG